MTDTTLYTKIASLPSSLREEVLHYLEYLLQKQRSEKHRKHPKAGCMKGTFTMADDFNEPPEDFKPYMQ